MSRIALPRLDGASASKNSVPVIEAKDQVLDAGMTLDLVPPPGMDEGRAYPSEIQEPRTNLEKLNDYAYVVKTTPSQQLNATLVKAQLAKRAKIVQVKGSTPDGSPAPDVLGNIQVQLEDLRLQNGKQFQLLEDLQRRLPMETPLQDQGAPAVSQVKYMTVPGHDTTILKTGTTPTQYPTSNTEALAGHKRLAPEAPEQPNMDEVEIQRFIKRNKAALDSIYYENEHMQKRAEANPEASGVYPRGGAILW